MKLALGTVQFGLDYGVTNHDGQVAIDEVKNILDYAKDKGIGTLDTASGYGNSEQVLGEVGVNNYRIITKTTPLKNGVDGVIKGFHQSLDSLNIGQVDGLLIHNIDDTKDKRFGELFHKLNELKEEGMIKKIGFSTYTPEQVNFLLENFDFDLIQVP
ncbi:MAG: aldo/keto reductase, partial [Candidatus Thioglobus sp.]